MDYYLFQKKILEKKMAPSPSTWNPRPSTLDKNHAASVLVIFYLTASLSQLRYFCYFLISRRDGENNGFLAGVPLLPPPSRVVSRPNSLPLPFRTPATQATFTVAFVMFSSLGSYSRLFFFRDLACSLACLFTFYIVM